MWESIAATIPRLSITLFAKFKGYIRELQQGMRDIFFFLKLSPTEIHW